MLNLLMLGVICSECHIQRCYAECHYVEYRGATKLTFLSLNQFDNPIVLLKGAADALHSGKGRVLQYFLRS
jgi:hypothetical protein